jgi:hypothetical protein
MKKQLGLFVRVVFLLCKVMINETFENQVVRFAAVRSISAW